MANIAIILGKSGTGKSTSLRNLDPKETVVVNTLRKKIPFKGSSSVYSTENKNMFQSDGYNKVIELLKNIDAHAPHVRNIILDDLIYIMRKEYFDRAREKGYEKYTELAVHMQNIIETCENMRDDLNIFLIFHSEDVTSDGTLITYKISTIGALLDKQYNPVEVVPMVLYSDAIFDDVTKSMKYGFYTHRVLGQKGIEMPAKSPYGMFEEDFIPNDLALVCKAMNEYYQ